MGFDASKFEKNYPSEKTKKEVEEAKTKGGEDMPELPDGEYTCKIDVLELGESNAGAAMLKARFRITEGEHSRKCIFLNKVLTGTKNDGFMMLQACRFLKSLEAVEDAEVVFESWQQFDDLVRDIDGIAFNDDMRFVVDYRTNKKNPQYHDVNIVMVL
jgi:hypothetical protein